MQIVQLMAEEKGWWWWRKGSELRKAQQYLHTFHPKQEHDSREIKSGESATGMSTPAPNAKGS